MMEEDERLEGFAKPFQLKELSFLLAIFLIASVTTIQRTAAKLRAIPLISLWLKIIFLVREIFSSSIMLPLFIWLSRLFASAKNPILTSSEKTFRKLRRWWLLAEKLAELR